MIRKAMLGCLVIALLASTSRSLGLNCIRDFGDAEEAVLNGSLGPQLLPNLSSAFYPTRSEVYTDYLTIQYLYVLNCSDGGHSSNRILEYVWVSSSVYLVVEPNALKDLTCGIVDVTRGSLSINLKCLCPTYPDDVTSIISRLTAYLRCYAKTRTKPSNDDDCKSNSFIRRYDSHDPLYKKVVDVTHTLKVVSWLSFILIFFLQLQVLNTLYTFVHENHKNFLLQKKSFDSLQTIRKDTSCETDYLPVAWATFYVAIVLLFVILKRDMDAGLVDCNTITDHDYKELYIGVYSTWLVGLLVAFYFPKHARFPVPVLTALFNVHQMKHLKHTRLFKLLTYIAQSIMIWILFSLIQLLTLHVIFLLVALLAKPVVTVLITIVYVSTFIGLAISGTSVMLEVFSLERINPWRDRRFYYFNYLKDLPSLIASMLLPTFILALMFVSYQFGEKLGSTLDLTGAPAAIVGIVHSIIFFIVSIALRVNKFRNLFKLKDKDYIPKTNASSNSTVTTNDNFWPHKFVYDDDYDILLS